MALVDNMAVLASKLIKIPKKLGYPLYTVSDLAGTKPFDVYGVTPSQSAYLDFSNNFGANLTVLPEYLKLLVPVDKPKPDQDTLIVNGEKYVILGVVRTVIYWEISLRKDLDLL